MLPGRPEKISSQPACSRRSNIYKLQTNFTTLRLIITKVTDTQDGND